MVRFHISLAATGCFLLLPGACATAQKVIDPVPRWNSDAGSSAIGPALAGSAEHCTGIVVTRTEGSILMFKPDGSLAFSTHMDFPSDSSAAVSDLNGDGKQAIITMDCQGSVYAFDLSGKRLWKFTQVSKARDFRVPVTADLDGDGKREILISDSRGSMVCLHRNGRLRMKIDASRYRVSAPAAGPIGHGRFGILFGTEAGDLDCVDRFGKLLWTSHPGGGLGRSLPLLMQENDPIALISKAFVDAHPAICALDASTGHMLWSAPCASQSYHSISSAVLNEGEAPSILYGDKNTRLYCVDKNGKKIWTSQLDGRGIFFTPAIARMNNSGKATIFLTVRGEGSAGNSLYVLDHDGHEIDAIRLPGGGSSVPLICRYRDEKELHLVTLSGGRLLCHRLNQGINSQILWSGLRNDPGNTGSVGAPPYLHHDKESAWPVHEKAFKISPTGMHKMAQAIENMCEHISSETAHSSRYLRLQGPDGIMRVYIRNENEAASPGTDLLKQMYAPGDYWAETFVDHPGRVSVKNFRITHERSEGRMNTLLRAISANITAIKKSKTANTSSNHLFQQLNGRLAADVDQANEIPDAADLERVYSQSLHLLALAKVCAAERPRGAFLIQLLKNPWPTHSSLDLIETAQAAPFAISMLGNAFQSEAISVTNLTAKTLRVRSEIINAEAGLKPIVSVRDCVKIVPGTTGIPTEDPLPALQDGNNIAIEPGESRKLWLTFCSRGWAPGTHRLMLRIGDPASLEPPADTPIKVTILPLALPEKKIYRHINWLYLASIGDPALREKTMQDALDHGTNVFNIPPCTVKVDANGSAVNTESTAHDLLVQQLRGKAEFLIDGSVEVTWPAGVNPSPDASEKAYADAVHWYADHMRSLGCSYGDYALYLADEPGLTGDDSSYRHYVEIVRRVKAIDPQMRIFCNPAGGASADVLASVADSIDVWCPDMHLVKQQPPALQSMFHRKGEYWHYEAPGDQRNLDPLGFYRMQPWVSFRYGMTGGGFWVYSQTPDWFTDPARTVEYGVVYPSPAGPVTTKRWEAAREGMQDFELLWMLKEACQRTQGIESDKALRLLNEAAANVTKGQENTSDIGRQVSPIVTDYASWMRYRQLVIQALQHLQ